MSSLRMTPFESNFCNPSIAELKTVWSNPAESRCNSENNSSLLEVVELFVLTETVAEAVNIFFLAADFLAVANMKSRLAKHASIRVAGFFSRRIGERGL